MKPSITFTLDHNETPFTVIRFEGKEALSRDYHFHLILECSGNERISIEDYLNQPCAICLNLYDDAHQLSGVIKGMQQHFSSNPNQKRYEIDVSSILYFTQTNNRSDIFTHISATQIISERLDSYPFIHHHMAALETLPNKTFTHQFKESDFNFINRLCEHWGVYYYFDYEDDDKLIFADDNLYPVDERNFEFIEQPSAEQYNHAIMSLNSKFEPAISHLIVEGRNPENDMLLIHAEAGEPTPNKPSESMSLIGVDDENEAYILAQRTLEQSQCQSIIYTGTTRAIGLKPGFAIHVSITGEATPLELLITEVHHQAVNLDTIESEQVEEYVAHFKAIPSSHVYRPEPLTPKPNAISSTARIFSSYESPSISHRDHLGRYQVMFDFLQSEKVSHWLRRSLTAAKDNHLDIPLLPGTEVQISYLGGNPDLPYISCALENSQSTQILSNNENPFTANLSTTGLLKLEAGRSISTSFRAPFDRRSPKNPSVSQAVTTPSSPIATPSNYQRLNNLGELFTPNETLSDKSMDYHLSSTEGQFYNLQDTISFYLGDNQNYYFGQQYREVHAKAPDADHVTSNNRYFFSQDLILEEDKAYFDPSLNISIEKQVGISRKLFGNRYNVHDGHIITVRKSDNGPHKSLNYGARYIENIQTDQHTAINSMTQGFPEDYEPCDNDYVIRTQLKQFRINHDDMVTIQNGHSYIKRVGDTTRIQEQGSSTVKIRGTSRDKDIEVTEHSKKKIKASSIETKLEASDVYKKINGNSRNETYGSSNSMVIGTKTSLIVGPKVEFETPLSSKTIAGMKAETILGAKMEAIAGPITKWYSNVENKIGPGNIKKEGFSLKNAEVEINKMKAEISCIENFVYTGRIFLIG